MQGISPVRFGKLIVDRDQLKAGLGEAKSEIVEKSLEDLKDPVNTNDGPFEVLSISPGALAILDDNGIDVKLEAGQKDVDGDLFRTLSLELIRQRDNTPVFRSKQTRFAREVNESTVGNMLIDAANVWLAELGKVTDVAVRAMREPGRFFHLRREQGAVEEVKPENLE